MSTIRIHTTQNVTLEYEIAGVGDRFVATLIDYLLYLTWFIFCGLVVSKIGFLGFDEGFMFVMFLPTTFYFLLCEVFFNGQTLGKKARHLRVVRLDGTRPGLGDYLLRWLLRPVEIVFTMGGPALISVLVSSKGQRLGDLAAGTTVISLQQRPEYSTPLAMSSQLPENYQPVFPQVAVLSDHDAALLRRLLHHSDRQQNYMLLHETALKVKSITGIQTDLPDEPFLETVLRDHAYLAAQ